MENKIKYIAVKYLLIGDCNVGKSSLIQQFTINKFNKEYFGTIGIDYTMFAYIKNNIPIKMLLWDTSGDKKFKTICRSIYHETDYVFLVFDLSNKLTFDNIQNWINEINDFFCTKTYMCPRMILIGNKCDTENRQVTYEEATNFANKHKIDYIETSVIKSINIKEAFITIIDKYDLKKDFHYIENPEDIENYREKMHAKSDYKSFLELLLKNNIIETNTTTLINKTLKKWNEI